MISLRSLLTLSTVVATALTLAACNDNTTSLATGLQPGDSKASLSSSKTVTGDVDARVLLDKSGNAILEVHAGTFNDGTNTATPVGTLSSFTYTVKDAANKNKTVTGATVKFSKSTASYFYHLSLCQSQGDDDDDDDGSSRASSCNSHWGSQYVLTFTASLNGLGSGGKSTGTASGTASVFNLPDLDLSQQHLYIEGAGGSQTLATNVNPSTATTFTVPFPNNKAIGGVANAVGAQTVCVVTVDGLPQLPLPNGVYNKFLNPNAFGYVGSATENISAGSIGSCDFTLTLPAGTHKIVVTAGVLYPGDYDLSNNSTSTFTVNAAVTGPPDIKADVLHQSPDAPLTTPPIVASTTTPTVLTQWVTLVSGAQPGTVTCTITALNTTTNETTTGTGTLTTSLPAACSVPVILAHPGAYTLTSVVATSGDTSLANNTAVNSVTVLSGPPSATVTVTGLSFSDATVGAASDLISTGPGAEDLVYSGDLVTYTATVNASALINTSAVGVSCKAFDGTTDISSAVTWTSGPTLSAVVAGNATCAFIYAFPAESDNAAHTHNIKVSVTTATGTTNNATTGTSFTGAISDRNGVDILASVVQRVGDGTTAGASKLIPFDTTTYGQLVTFNAVFSNPTTRATTINCTITADPALSPTAVGSVTNVSLPAKGTAICKYTVLPTTIGPYPITVSASPTASSPADPNLGNNTFSISPNAKSTGAFQVLPTSDAINITQSWMNPKGEPTSSVAPDGFIQNQLFPVTHLALIVVPSQAVLGQFGMTASVTSGADQSVNFGTAVVPFQTLGVSSCIGTPGPTPLNLVTDAGLSYTASICGADAPDKPGYQTITISYTLSSAQLNVGDPALVFASSVVMKLSLDFSLVSGATTPDDHVQATITVPVTGNVNCKDYFGTANLCSTVFGPATITTP